MTTCFPARHWMMVFALLLLCGATSYAPRPVAAADAPPTLWLPTPIGETWQVLQGFQCGSHVGHQARSLDLVNLSGSTTGAPVRAAAAGSTFVWQGSTGTLIVAHGGGYYSMYTHLSSVITRERGVAVQQGEVIGRAGSVGTDIAHLHVTFFYAPDQGAYQRTSLELDFADGYSFHDLSGCNQHRGATVVAGVPTPDTSAPEVTITSATLPAWSCADAQITFQFSDDRALAGFRQVFDRAPAADDPTFQGTDGYVQLAWAGEGSHTLHIQAWDAAGNTRDLAVGPFGYDTQPPRFAMSALSTRMVAASTPATLSWTAANDGLGSGVRGYKLYLGSDAQGQSEWFSENPRIQIDGLPPGHYYLRAQPLDSCGAGAWVTLEELLVE